MSPLNTLSRSNSLVNQQNVATSQIKSPQSIISVKFEPPNPKSANNHSSKAEDDRIKPTFKRYIILLLFCINSGNKSLQWIQVAASTKKATLLYGVENYVINITGIIFMLSFLVLSWPACCIIDRFGLRKAVLMASFGTAVGATVKCFSCHENGIWLLMLGQVLVSLSEQLIFSVPSRLASVWFPDHQVSSAVSLSVFGQQIGVALGFLVPQWYLMNADTKDQIADGFYGMFLLTAAISVVAYLLDYIFFTEEPKYAPGAARLRQLEIERASANQHETESVSTQLIVLFRKICRLLSNRHLVTLSISYGINVGLGYTVSTLLNQLLEPIWPDSDMIVGNTGFLYIIAGAIGLPIWGRSLDRWHAFKRTNVLLTVATLVSQLAFLYALVNLQSIMGVYIAATVLGFFQTGLVATGLELAVELTYPEPELVTSSIMNVMPQIFGTPIIFIGSYIVDTHGPLAANVFFLACMLIALLTLTCSRETLKRQEAILMEKQRCEANGA